MILDRPGFKIFPVTGPTDGRETARVVNGLATGRGNQVIDLDLSAEVSPYLLEHPNISPFSWIRAMRDEVTVGEPGDQSVTLTWVGTGPALVRLLVLG